MSFTQLVSLTQMQNTTRRMTARYSEAQMSTTQINYYLNLFMTLQFPLHFKNLKLTKPYVFTTVPNVDTYDFVYQQGLPNPIPTIISKITASIGNSGASPWSFNIYSTYVPAVVPPIGALIVPGSVIITIATGTPIVLTDQGNGLMTSPIVGNSATINYNNGNIVVTHTAGAGIASTASFAYSTPNNFNPPGNIQITPPAYCQGYLLRYYHDKTIFYNRWPKLSVNQQINIGTGKVTTYTGVIPPFPFLRAQLDINGNVTEAAVIISTFDNTGFNYSISDIPQPNNNIGNLVDKEGNVVGTVNYLTGAYSFAPFVGVIPAGDIIYASVVPYQSSRPTDVLFYNQQITFRPCPQQVYQVEFQISQQPTQLIANNQAPELDEWYLFICSGAGMLIYADFPDPEGEAALKNVFQEQLQLAQRRTLRQMGSQRASTIFSQPGRPLAGYFYGSEYSGGISS
jgi:hypothetical protein